MRTIIFVSLAAFLVLSTGCKPVGNHTEIQGNVTLDGTPLLEGSILFVPIEGTHGIATGTTIVDGHYAIARAKGPAVGRNRVQIQALRATGQKVPNPLSPNGPPIEMRVGAIPARFNTASELKVDVHEGANVANFEVLSH